MLVRARMLGRSFAFNMRKNKLCPFIRARKRTPPFEGAIIQNANTIINVITSVVVVCVLFLFCSDVDLLVVLCLLSIDKIDEFSKSKILWRSIAEETFLCSHLSKSFFLFYFTPFVASFVYVWLHVLGHCVYGLQPFFSFHHWMGWVVWKVIKKRLTC